MIARFLWPCPKWNTSCALAVLQTYNGRCVHVSVKGVEFLILAFRRVLASAPFAAVMRPRSALRPSPHWCKLAADFYPTVKGEDREDLECHLGQGRCLWFFLQAISFFYESARERPPALSMDETYTA